MSGCGNTDASHRLFLSIVCCRLRHRPLGSLQWRETHTQQPDLVTRADDVSGADPHGDLVDLLQVVVELGQKARGGVLLEAQELTGSKEEQNHQLAGTQR